MKLRDKVFNTESGVYTALSEITNILMFGICWMVCCIPILTIGPATSALYKMFFDMRRDKKTTFTMFFKAFAESFKNAFLIELIQILIGLPIAFIYYMAYISVSMYGASKLLYLPVFVVAFIWIVTFAYTYAYTAFFEQKIGLTIKNSFIMAFAHIKNTLVMILLTLILPAIYILVPNIFYILMPIWILALIPMVHWWKSYFYKDVFDIYSTDTKETDERESTEA